LFFKGRFSEELIDFHEALKYFLKAEKAVQTEALFFVDYGNVFFELDRLTKDSKLLDQAIELYKQATKKDSNCFEAWSNLACCYTEFFFNKRAPSYFHLANDCFTKLALIQKENRDFYFKWGQLLLNYAKSFHEESLLPKSIECFQLAEDSFAPKPVLYRFTAEALLLFGVFTDQLALLKLAENKIRLSLDLDPKDPNSWCLLGHLKSEFGRYFDEETYFLDAIEAFEKGLEISENHPILHFGLATACFAFGDLKNEFSFLEKAYKACTQVVATGASPPDHFWNDWGIIALKMAEFTKNTDSLKEAIRLFEKACELQKMQERHLSSDLLVNLGVAWQLLGDFEDDEKALVMSREILSEALRGDPLFVTAHHQLALTLVELGEMTSDMGSFKLAVEHFTQAIHLDSEDDHIFHDFAMGLIHQSILFHYLGEKEACSKVIREAEKLLKRAIALGNEGAFYTLACLHSLLGNLEQSLEALKKAESLEALPSEEDLLEDEWLENLRQSDLFTSFLEKR
jgi:tetratricopeptide (TPR) repeat protein